MSAGHMAGPSTGGGWRPPSRAIQEAVDALNAARQTSGPRSAEAADALSNLAETYQRHGKFEQAEPAFTEMLEIHETTLGTGDRRVLADLKRLTAFYRAWGREDRAREYAQRAASFQGDPFVEKVREAFAEMPAQPSLAEQIEEELGAAPSADPTRRFVAGVVLPALLALLGIYLTTRDKVCIRAYRDYFSKPIVIHSRPAAIAQGIIVLCLALGLHCHFRISVKSATLAGYGKLLAFGLGAAALAVYLQKIWTF